MTIRHLTTFAFAIMLAGGTAFAQDRIITKEGETIEVYNVEISDRYIFYTKDKAEDAAIARMPKDAVLLIKRQDGSTVNLYETAAVAQPTDAQSAAAQNQSPMMLTPDQLDEAARRTNTDLIAQANQPVTFVPGEEKFLEKEANKVWFRMGIQEGSVLDDGTVSLELKPGYFGWANNKWRDYTYAFYAWEKDSEAFDNNPALQVTVTNRSNRTVYIELGNSFFIRMGQTQCYYVPSSTSVSSSTSSGTGLNVGAVTGALGIGGVVGTIANGVNVGSGGSNESTTVTYTQRIITIPPRSTVNLEAQWLFGPTEKEVLPGLTYGKWRGLKGRYQGIFSFPKDAPEGPLMNGQHLAYSEASSPFRLSVLVAYSYSEDGNAPRTLSANLYLKDLIGRNLNAYAKYRGNVQYEGTPVSFGGDLNDKKGAVGFPRP